MGTVHGTAEMIRSMSVSCWIRLAISCVCHGYTVADLNICGLGMFACFFFPSRFIITERFSLKSSSVARTRSGLFKLLMEIVELVLFSKRNPP